MEPYLEKVCLECGGEYQPTIERCADCGVPLVFRQEIAWRDARELPAGPGLVPLRTAPILWVRALAAELERAGVSYRIDRRRAREEGVETVLVRRRDHEEAVRVDEERCRVDPPPPLEDEDEEAEEVPVRGRVPRALEPGDADYRVCPACGSEFQPGVARCADCGAELVDAGDLAGPEEEEVGPDEPAPAFEEDFYTPPGHELAEAAGLACLACFSLRTLQGLSAALDDAGIAHRIAGSPGRDGCLYVLPADRGRAMDVISRLGEVPPGEEPPDLSPCPACGARLPSGAPECPDCGLSFAAPQEDVPCPRCGALLAASQQICPNCGTASVVG